MPIQLPRFYPILDPSLRPDLSLEELVHPLLDAGVRLLQLRMKGAPGGALFDAAQRLKKMVSGGIHLIVNDRADVARLTGATGVHLGQEDLSPDVARHILGEDAIVGLSTHTKDQVHGALGDSDARLDYLAYGPIFRTRTKPNSDSVVGPGGLGRIREIYAGPLVAIGGVNPGNAAQVIENGADSVAVISAWMTADDIPGCLERFREALGRLD